MAGQNYIARELERISEKTEPNSSEDGDQSKKGNDNSSAVTEKADGPKEPVSLGESLDNVDNNGPGQARQKLERLMLNPNPNPYPLTDIDDDFASSTSSPSTPSNESEPDQAELKSAQHPGDVWIPQKTIEIITVAGKSIDSDGLKDFERKFWREVVKHNETPCSCVAMKLNEGKIWLLMENESGAAFYKNLIFDLVPVAGRRGDWYAQSLCDTDNKRFRTFRCFLDDDLVAEDLRFFGKMIHHLNPSLRDGRMEAYALEPANDSRQVVHVRVESCLLKPLSQLEFRPRYKFGRVYLTSGEDDQLSAMRRSFLSRSASNKDTGYSAVASSVSYQPKTKVHRS